MSGFLELHCGYVQAGICLHLLYLVFILYFYFIWFWETRPHHATQASTQVNPAGV